MLHAPAARRNLLLLLLVTLLIWFGTLEYRKLVRPDEGRYAEIPREMVATGDWLTPRLNGIKYFEKPALQYWATAAAYEVFGEHAWTSRLWSALTGFLGVLFAAFAGCRLFGARAGLYAALVLGSSLLYALIAHINTLDMGVTFFMGAGLMGFLLAQREGVAPRERRNWMWFTWASLALSVLSKGLIGVVLPGAVLVLYSLLERDFALWKRLHLLSGLAIFMLIAAPWFIAVSLANPEFFHFFFIHEHFERFLTKVHHRVQPWWSFVPLLLLGMLPWVVTMIDTLLRAWGHEPGRRDHVKPQRFLLIWSVFIFVFFSASSSKLPSYILPIFPALALLIGVRLDHMRARTLFWQTLPIASVAALALWLSPRITEFADVEVPLALYQKYLVWAVWAAALWLGGTLLGLYFSYRDRTTAAVATLAISMLIAGQVALLGHDSLSPSNSAYHIAQKIKPYLRPDAPFYSVGTYAQTLPFYIKRTVTLVDFQDEMQFGLDQEPDKWIPDMKTFEQIWRKQRYALAMMSPETYDSLARQGLPMREIARDTRRVVVTTP
jgi:4-amino-4-deoxy-L-arabinose transferase-like glycosyltransferase